MTTVEERLAWLEARVAQLEAQLRMAQPYQPMMPPSFPGYPVLPFTVTCDASKPLINAAFDEAANRG